MWTSLTVSGLNYIVTDFFKFSEWVFYAIFFPQFWAPYFFSILVFREIFSEKYIQQMSFFCLHTFWGTSFFGFDFKQNSNTELQMPILLKGRRISNIYRPLSGQLGFPATPRTVIGQRDKNRESLQKLVVLVPQGTIVTFGHLGDPINFIFIKLENISHTFRLRHRLSKSIFFSEWDYIFKKWFP